MSGNCCPACGRRVGKGWRALFTEAEKAEIVRLHLKERVKQTHLARALGCGQGTISKIVASATSMVFRETAR